MRQNFLFTREIILFSNIKNTARLFSFTHLNHHNINVNSNARIRLYTKIYYLYIYLYKKKQNKKESSLTLKAVGYIYKSNLC